MRRTVDTRRDAADDLRAEAEKSKPRRIRVWVVVRERYAPNGTLVSSKVHTITSDQEEASNRVKELNRGNPLNAYLTVGLVDVPPEVD